MKRSRHCYVEWGYGCAAFTLRTWTRRGAIREAYKVAKRLKPKADVQFVQVER